MKWSLTRRTGAALSTLAFSAYATVFAGLALNGARFPGFVLPSQWHGYPWKQAIADVFLIAVMTLWLAQLTRETTTRRVPWLVQAITLGTMLAMLRAMRNATDLPGDAYVLAHFGNVTLLVFAAGALRLLLRRWYRGAAGRALRPQADLCRSGNPPR